MVSVHSCFTKFIFVLKLLMFLIPHIIMNFCDWMYASRMMVSKINVGRLNVDMMYSSIDENTKFALSLLYSLVRNTV